MAGGAGDGEGDFVAGFDSGIGNAAYDVRWAKDDGFELGGFAEPDGISSLTPCPPRQVGSGVPLIKGDRRCIDRAVCA